MQSNLYRLTFQGGLHVGQRGIGIEETYHRLTSDTLFAALIARLALRGQDRVDKLMARFPRRDAQGQFRVAESEPPFLLSSTFPFVGEVLCFPTPMLTFEGKEDAVGKDHKILKKVKYVSEGVFRALLAGESLTDFSPTASDPQHKFIALQKGAVWITEAERAKLPSSILPEDPEKSKIWDEFDRPRVTIDRVTHASSVFSHGEIHFAEGCGLWFVIHWRDERIQPMIEALLDELGIYGLGGLRSRGVGAISSIEKGKTLELPDVESNLAVSLSRYSPAPGEFTSVGKSETAYRLVEVGGYMAMTGGADQQRKRLTMLEEGAVLPSAVGQVVDVQPQGAKHPSWRYGLMFPAGLLGKGQSA